MVSFSCSSIRIIADLSSESNIWALLKACTIIFLTIRYDCGFGPVHFVSFSDFPIKLLTGLFLLLSHLSLHQVLADCFVVFINIFGIACSTVWLLHWEVSAEAKGCQFLRFVCALRGTCLSVCSILSSWTSRESVALLVATSVTELQSFSYSPPTSP